ncbi:type IV secretion system protein TraC [Thiotrichales bacterium 19S9-12]|nr:type IV secretion system protein TraC [Thiotrichales bacterium 19S9-11]MCF6812530.1 type IV secretion system protein TraC [Thiotrichales bacterium 19S9-12]
MLGQVKEITTKIGQYFGLIDSVEDASYHKATTDISDYRYPSFSDELPYEYFDDRSHVFFNKHNAGIIYQISPLTGANEAIAEQLDGIIRTKISDEFIITAIHVKHNQLGNKIDRFASQFRDKNLGELSALGDSLEAYYKKACVSGFKTRNETETRLTQTEIYLVIDTAKKNQSENDLIIAFDRFKVSFEAALTASSISFKLCDSVDFLHLIQFYTAHNTDDIYPSKISHQEDNLLKYQVNDRSFELSVDDREKDHLRLSGDDRNGKSYQTDISVLTIDKLPSSFRLWENINNTSNIFDTLYHINCNHIITAIYKLDEHGKALSKANRKTRDLTKKSRSDYATLVAGTEEQAQQWKSFREDLTKQKTRSCKMLYNVVLFSKPSKREVDVEKAKNAFNLPGIKLSVCKRMQMPYFLASMPFMFTNHLQYDFALPMMMHHISSWNATQYLPVLSDWHGQDKGILLPSMRGQFSLVDPFSGFWGTNFNAAVTGTSGAGKSFLMQMMALSTLFDGGYVYIIDIGGSYRKLCEAVNGVYLEYSNLALNPFTYVRNIYDSIDNLIDLFEEITCSKEKASNNQTAALRAAILDAFQRKGNAALVDDVQESLRNLDQGRFFSAKALAENIDPFTSKAEHGRVFNERSKFDPKSRFIVIDLLEIKDKKSLVSPVLMSAFNQVKNTVYLLDRSIKKQFIMDEGWKFFAGSPRAIEFLIEGFRTGRRHNASFVTITQGISDYTDFPAAKALWDNAALKLILLQDSSKLDQFNKEHEMFNEYELNILKKFPQAKEAGYSQVLIKGQNLQTFQRLFVDPFTLVMMSSAGEDYSAVEALKKKGVPLLEAVNQVAKAHYGDMYV